eukprot:916717-Rhodomonas_salina.1
MPSFQRLQSLPQSLSDCKACAAEHTATPQHRNTATHRSSIRAQRREIRGWGTLLQPAGGLGHTSFFPRVFSGLGHSSMSTRTSQRATYQHSTSYPSRAPSGDDARVGGAGQRVQPFVSKGQLPTDNAEESPQLGGPRRATRVFLPSPRHRDRSSAPLRLRDEPGGEQRAGRARCDPCKQPAARIPLRASLRHTQQPDPAGQHPMQGSTGKAVLGRLLYWARLLIAPAAWYCCSGTRVDPDAPPRVKKKGKR